MSGSRPTSEVTLKSFFVNAYFLIVLYFQVHNPINMANSLVVGAKFASFDELSAAIKALEHESCVNFHISDSKRLTTAAKAVPKICALAKPELVYYHLTYSCIHGGKQFHTSSKGARPNQRLLLNV